MTMFKVYCLTFILLSLGFIHAKENTNPADTEDNEFAEFETADEEPVIKKQAQPKPVETSAPEKPVPNEDAAPSLKEDKEKKLEDATVETENDEDEFSHFLDKEEFEGYTKNSDRFSKKDGAGGTGNGGKKNDLKFANVPTHLHTSWESFYLEMLMIAGLAVYFLNFIVGKSKNSRLANAWYASHKDLLEREFHIVGDDGTAKEATSGTLMKESEHVYSLWCSGRVCVEGMLVELKLIKRQDIISLLAKLLKPVSDTVQVKITMDESPDLDGFVMAVAQKRRAAQMLRDYVDLATYCPERKSPGRLEIPDSFCIMSEIGEAAQAILDHKVCTTITRYEDNIDYIHISDQYSGPKTQQDDGQPVKLPETKRALVFSFKVGRKGATTASDMENLRPLFQMVFYVLEKVRKVKLSKEAKSKGEKKRQRAAESVEKLVHSQRQEAAQQRREDKRKADKERLLQEEDPERARRLEARVDKAENKRKGPKMKMMKVKGM